MKKFVLTMIAVAAFAAPAAAQYGDISTYSDAAGTSCDVLDDTAPFKFIDTFLIHKHADSGATGSTFGLTLTGGTLTNPSFTWGSVVGLGTIDNLNVGYPSCLSGDIYLAKVTWIGVGTSPPCSHIQVIASTTTPIPGEIVVVDCAFGFQIGAGGTAIINPDVSCPCSVPVRETTWGGIKALYR